MEKNKWIQSVDLLIQNYFENSLRQINEKERQSIPLNDLKRFNENVLYAKDTYKNAREEVFLIFNELGIKPLALIPVTMVHSFGLSSGTVHEFHHIETDEEFNIIIQLPKDDVLEEYENSRKKSNNVFVIEEIVKNYTAHTASGRGASCTKVSLPDITMFQENISFCKKAGVKTTFYPTIGNYHLKSFIDSKYWDTFLENEDLLLVSMYKFKNHKERGEIFQVVLDQIPTTDKYSIVQRYEIMCGSKYLPVLHSTLGNNKFIVGW